MMSLRLDGYSLPIVVSVALHVVLIVAVTWGWDAKQPERRIQTPNFVQATLVELTARAPEPVAAPRQNVIDVRARQQEQERQRQEAERRRQQEQQRQARERQQQQERERTERERREREQRQAEERRRAEELRLAEQQRRETEQRAAQQRLDEALDREEEFLDAQRSMTQAQSYVAQIAARIEQNWSRPPSARVGMECELLIQLVPTGQVVNVTVVRSSGNAAFDRSAEQAVTRVDRFTEVQGMPSDLFERQFRQLRLVFRPGDLRL